MFNRIKAFFVKLKAEKLKKQSEKIYIFSHILLILFNNTKMMKGLTDQQRKDVFSLYTKIIFDSMTDENKVYFTKALNDTSSTVDQIWKNVPTNEIQIKRQLEEIFRSSGV